MFTIKRVMLLFVALAALTAYGQQTDKEQKARLCGMVWVDSSEIESRLGIKTLVVNCKSAGIETLIVDVKPESGLVFWRTAAFGDATAKVVESFDPLAKLLEEAHKDGLKVHVALCALRENAETSVSFKKHPEWAMRNAQKKTTGEIVWMCPARRDGYVQKWLLPLMEELLKNYDIDGLHLYGLSYPVSAPSDAFCFCDWCLEDFHRRVFLEGSPSAEKLADRKEREWLKPSWWENAPRKKKVEYLLKGSSLSDGSVTGMNFFFYDYRCAAIKGVVEDVFALIRKVKPDIFFSASVFSNPERAARLAGQRWTEWAHYLDFLIVDASRKWHSGTYEEYLKSLKGFSSLKKRLEGRTYIYPLVSVDALYREVFDAFDGMESCLDRIEKSEENKKVYEELERHYSVVTERLKGSDSETMKEMDAALMRLKRAVEKNASDEEAVTLIRSRITGLRNNPPKGFFRFESLKDALSSAVDGGAEGVVLTSASAIDRFGFWKALRGILAGSTPEPFRTRPLTAHPCMGALRGLRTAERVIRSLKLHIEKVETEADALRGQLERSQAKETKEKEEVKTLTARLKALQERMAKLKDTLNESKRETEELREEVERERSNFTLLKKRLEDELRKEREKSQSVEDEMKAIQMELKRVQTEVREHLLRLSEDAQKLSNESEGERLTVVVVFMVAAAVFAIALILSVAFRRKHPGED